MVKILCTLCTEAVSSLQRPGFESALWPSAACHPPLCLCHFLSKPSAVKASKAQRMYFFFKKSWAFAKLSRLQDPINKKAEMGSNRGMHHWTTCVHWGRRGGEGSIQCCPHNSHWGLSRCCEEKERIVRGKKTTHTHTNTHTPNKHCQSLCKVSNCGCDRFCFDCYLRVSNSSKFTSQPNPAYAQVRWGACSLRHTLWNKAAKISQQKDY